MSWLKFDWKPIYRIKKKIEICWFCHIFHLEIDKTRVGLVLLHHETIVIHIECNKVRAPTLIFFLIIIRWHRVLFTFPSSSQIVPFSVHNSSIFFFFIPFYTYICGKLFVALKLTLYILHLLLFILSIRGLIFLLQFFN